MTRTNTFTRAHACLRTHAYWGVFKGSAIVIIAAYWECMLLDLFTASVTWARAPMFRSCSCGGVELLTTLQLQPLSAFKCSPAQQVFRASKVSHRSEHVCVCVSLAALQYVGAAHAASGVVRWLDKTFILCLCVPVFVCATKWLTDWHTAGFILAWQLRFILTFCIGGGRKERRVKERRREKENKLKICKMGGKDVKYDVYWNWIETV